MRVCKKHKKTPAVIYGTCIGCELDGLHAELAARKDLSEHPDFENFIRAFWRRIYVYKDKYGKELPEELPVEFRASMATALLAFKFK